MDDDLDLGPPASAEDFWTQTLNERPVRMQWQDRELHGVLCLLKSDDFTAYRSRFEDISPSSMPRLIDGEACDPWTLLIPYFGKTWIPVSHLPKVAQMSSIQDALDGAQQPSFVALTDCFEVFEHQLHFNTGFKGELARCDMDGQIFLRVEVAKHSDKMIIAFDSKRPFNLLETIEVQPVLTVWRQRIQVTLWPPLAVPPSVLGPVEKIKDLIGNLQPGQLTGNLIWRLRYQLPAILDNDGNLPKTHPLYAHRGNEAVCTRDVWRALCCPIEYGMFQDERDIPAPYWQTLFLDLQARQRIEGT